MPKTRIQNPSKLLNRALALVAGDMRVLRAKKDRSGEDREAIARYVKLLHGISQADEQEIVKLQKKFAKLTNEELKKAVAEAAGLVEEKPDTDPKP